MCVADPLVSGESTTGILCFPWLAQDGTTLLLSYHDGGDGSTGTTRLKTSTDAGLTWSAGVTVWDDGTGTGNGAQITALRGGDWLLASQCYSGGSPTGVFTKRSTDKGVTWGATTLVGASYWTSSAIVELANGTLLYPVYNGSSGVNVAQVLPSTDGGVTWGSAVTICAVTSVGCNETVIRQLPSGQLVALVRCADLVIRRTTSCDSGATWSTPTVVTTPAGVDSRIDWVRLASGRSVATWRDATTLCAMVAYSDDDLVTLSTPFQAHGPDKRTSYAGLAEIAPNQILGIFGEIDSGEATGRLMARYLLNGHGMAPTGQVTYLTQQQLSAGAGDFVAWDSFSRPNNANGLGSADSGHQWLETGGTTNSDWKIVSGCATNTATNIHMTTLDPGNQWGFIEADLMWTGSTSSPQGLIAKRNTTNGHALIAKLDSNGGTLRISYTDGTTTTDLVTVNGLHYGAGVWHRWRFMIKDNLAVVTIDRREVASYVLTITDHTNLDAGTKWGLYGGGSSGVTYKAKYVLISS